MEEERRRTEVLANIEKARKEREAKRTELYSNLHEEKLARLAEIEKMQAEHAANRPSESRKAQA